MLRWVAIPLFIFLIIAGLFAFALIGDGPSMLPSALIGKQAPKKVFVPLPGLKRHGTPVVGFSHQDLAKGVPSVVNFWASWCAPCIAEHRFLTALKKEADVDIFGINYKDKATDARRFLGRFGNPYHAVGVDKDGRGAIEWGVSKVPETFVLDGAGKVLYRHAGPLTRAVLDKKILPKIRAATAQ